MENLKPRTAEEERPYKDLTGQVTKTDGDTFAGGGFSDLYRGILRDPVSGEVTVVAIKVLRGVHIKGYELEVTTRRLNRESRVWHKLDHPNVQPFLGICAGLGPSPALISRMCKNGNVVDYVKSHHLKTSDRLNFFKGFAEGLAYLHSQQVIHGDVKGQNVLIDESGIPCLCDFGRSKIIDEKGYTTKLIVGSGPFMAPELWGPKPVDFNIRTWRIDENFVPVLSMKADVYASAMVGLQVLALEEPYHYIPATWLAFTVLQREPPLREKYDINMPQRQWDLLAWCWQGEPEARPDMAKVVEKLKQL